MKRKLYIVIVLSLLVLAIFLITINSHLIPNGNFKRNFFERELLPTGLIGIPGFSYGKLLNISHNGIVISTNHPNEVVIVTGRSVKSLWIKHPSFFASPAGNYKEVADSNHIDIFKINSDSFLSASPWTLSFTMRVCPTFAFSRCAMSNRNTFVFRKYNSAIEDQVFATLSVPANLTEDRDISEIHHDWGVSTDGILLYNPELNRFIYVYFYRPKAILFDGQLRLIDSVILLGTASEQLSIANVSSNSKSHIATTDAPLVFCNKHACTYKNYLLIHSGAIAKNENATMFRHFETLDLYDLKLLKYLGSYHIPRYETAKIRDIKLYGDMLYVLYQNRLARFEMPFLK